MISGSAIPPRICLQDGVGEARQVAADREQLKDNSQDRGDKDGIENAIPSKFCSPFLEEKVIGTKEHNVVNDDKYIKLG